MKKNLTILLTALFLCSFALSACSSGGDSSSQETSAATTDTTASAESDASSESDTSSAEGSSSENPPEITEAIAETPIMLTSVGQSADVNVVQTLLERSGIECDLNAVVTADELEGYNTLILAVGGSSKGLGAAGIDEDQELERVESVIAQAQEQDMVIIALHIGGTARRGTLSDKFIPSAFNAADAAIIVSDGDNDGMMRNILAANNTPTTYVDNQIGCTEPLQILFGVNG